MDRSKEWELEQYKRRHENFLKGDNRFYNGEHKAEHFRLMKEHEEKRKQESEARLKKEQEEKLVGCFDVTFSGPNPEHGEFGGTITNVPLPSNNGIVYIDLKINGDPNPVRFHYHYEDAGTVGYARMKQQYAINGRLTNVTMDWSNPKPTDFRMLYGIGHMDKGRASIYVWGTVKKKEDQV